MKLTAFSCRKDEEAFFLQYGKKYGVEVVTVPEKIAMDNIHLAKGCEAVSVITTPVTSEMVEKLHEYGILVISTRTAGYEHIDYKRAGQLGITVSNVSYSPKTVAEYTVMCMLMAVRKMKTIITRFGCQDYSLGAVRGKELGRMCVGVIGTGNIGEHVIENLSGFGCKILAYDSCRKETVQRLADYVALEDIWRQCDVITMHVPASEQTFHLIREETIGKMKDGVVIINTARGSLIDTKALIEALERGKIGAAALDVIEGEGSIYYKDFKHRPVAHHQLAVLQAMPNVLMTPHTAFFTEEAVGDMVEFSIKSCRQTVDGAENPWKVNE